MNLKLPGCPDLQKINFLFVVISLIGVLLAACEFSASTPAPLPLSTGIADGTEHATWYQVYFSDPTAPSAGSFRGGPDQYLADSIYKARMSVDVAAYDLNLWSIRDALLDAHRRGVAIRMVTDSDNLDTPEVQELRSAGIPVLGDRREGLMHNKFVIVDRQDIWSGSMNLTINSAYRNNDNLIHLRSAKLAQNYTTEFEEMFLDDLFGPGSPANTPYPKLNLQGTQIQVYFSPDDGVEKQIISLLNSAQKSIKFLAYSFTSDPIADVMLERAKAGVMVQGVFEAQQVNANYGTEYERLREAGLDVRLDANPDNMHHKVIIIDERIVLTGSYNFSYNAETNNDENIIILDNPDIAAAYLVEFGRNFMITNR